MALTPEQLAQIQRTGSYVGPDGLSYTLLNNSGVGSEYGSGSDVFGNGMYAVGNYKPEGQYSIYDQNLQNTGRTGQYAAVDKFGNFLEGALPLALAGFGVAAGAGLLGGGAGAAGGAAGGTAGGSGAFLGEGALSGVPAWDGALTASQVGGVGGAAGAGGWLEGSSAGMTAPAGLGAAEAGTGLWGPGAAGLAGTAGLTAAGAAGAASALPSWLAPAAGVIGAIAGSQPQESESTTTKDIPEWLKPSVNSLLGYTNNLLDKQMAPGYMQGYDDMRSVGQSWLNTPVAGNGFAQFQAMPRFGSK